MEIRGDMPTKVTRKMWIFREVNENKLKISINLRWSLAKAKSIRRT